MGIEGQWHQELKYTEILVPSLQCQWLGFLEYPAPRCRPHWTQRSFWLHRFELISETPWTHAFLSSWKHWWHQQAGHAASLLHRLCSVSLRKQSGGGQMSCAAGQWEKWNTGELKSQILQAITWRWLFHKLIFSWKQARFIAVPTPHRSYA